MRGIDTVGTSLPRFRLPSEAVEEAWGSAPRGVEQVAVPAADEDAVTMAIAAAEDALSRSVVDREELLSLGFATTTPPLEEELLCGRLVRALDLPRTIVTRSETQSTLGAGRLLVDALDTRVPSLVVAADAPCSEPDSPMGAGAAAFLVTDDASVPVTDTAEYVDDAPGTRFRTRGDERVRGLGIGNYDRNVLNEHVSSAIDGLDDGDAKGAALHQPDGAVPYRIGGERFDSAVIARGTVVDRLGDSGAAGVPLGLCSALSVTNGSERTVAVFAASGGGALALACEGGLDRSLDLGGRAVDYTAYLRKRGYIADGEVAGGGANVSLPSWQRSLPARYRLVAGRCPDCRTLAFPPEGACPGCHEPVEYDLEELPREGRIVARTVVERGGAPPEFAAQQARDGSFCVAIVDCGGARLPTQVVDCDPDRVAVGDRVRAVIRRIYEQEGVPRYGVKFVRNG